MICATLFHICLIYPNTQQHRSLHTSTTAQGQQSTQQLLDVAQARLLFLISVGHAVLQRKLMVVKKCKQHAVTSREDDLCGFIPCVITLVMHSSTLHSQRRGALSRLPAGVCLCRAQRASVTCPVCHLLSLHSLPPELPLSLRLC